MKKHLHGWPLCAVLSLSLSLNFSFAAQANAGDAAMPAMASASLYRLEVPLTDAQGQRFKLRDMAGAPLLVTLFYGDCNTACPIILENLQQTIAQLKAPPGKIKVLMVSLDPLHDSPAGLAALALSHHLDPAVFRLAVAGDETHTRTMAAALDIKYRVLGGGEINHSTRISLLDAGGNIIASSARLGPEPDPALLQQIRQAAK